MSVTTIDITNLDDKITFGKYKGETWRSIINRNPKYVLWVSENVDFIEFTDEVLEKIQESKEHDDDNKPSDYYSGWGGYQNADNVGVFGDWDQPF